MAGRQSTGSAAGPEISTFEACAVVVGVDGSACSRAALRWAAQFASATGAQLHAVMVWHLPTATGWVMPPSREGVPERHAATLLEASLDDVFGAHRPSKLTTTVIEGHPATALINQARDADLLVVGSRGLGGFTAALLGSVGSYCSRHAPCPIAIVRN